MERNKAKESEINRLLLNKAIRLLSLRDYSESELRQKLTQFYVNQKNQIARYGKVALDSVVEQENILDAHFYQEINSVIQTVYYYGWLDDIKYICNYIKQYVDKGFGLKKIIWNLKLKGISQEFIDIAIEKCDINVSEQIVKIVKKKFGAINTKDWKVRNKIQGYLYSRGFNYSDIEDTLKIFY